MTKEQEFALHEAYQALNFYAEKHKISPWHHYSFSLDGYECHGIRAGGTARGALVLLEKYFPELTEE